MDPKLDFTLPKFCDFETTSGDGWTVGKFPALAEAFDLLTTDLTTWHRIISGQGRGWEIVKLLYTVGPFLQETPQEDHNTESIGERFGLPESAVKEEIAELVRLYRSKLNTEELHESIEDGKALDLDHYSGGKITPEQVAQILEDVRLGDIEDPPLRIHIANRAMALKHFLRQSNTKELARTVLTTEISIHSNERILQKLNVALNDLLDHEDAFTLYAKKIEGFEDRIRKAEKHLQDLSKKNRETLASMGADTLDLEETKRLFTGSLSEALDRMRDYYADPSNILMDGIFTPDEIVWLTEPQGDRPAQYRLDAVTLLNDALEPKNFMDPNYDTKITQEASRRLRRVVRLLEVEESKAAQAKLDAQDPDPDEKDTPATLETAPEEPESIALPPAPAPAEEDTFIVMG